MSFHFLFSLLFVGILGCHHRPIASEGQECDPPGSAPKANGQIWMLGGSESQSCIAKADVPANHYVYIVDNSGRLRAKILNRKHGMLPVNVYVFGFPALAEN
ncbi:MAG: hypothetical protein NUV56_01380 [Candidatus Uhrbacteria bacterium]|nr:hypothetical protein [Candidatus Uhrbacteria bacterium]